MKRVYDFYAFFFVLFFFVVFVLFSPSSFYVLCFAHDSPHARCCKLECNVTFLITYHVMPCSLSRACVMPCSLSCFMFHVHVSCHVIACHVHMYHIMSMFHVMCMFHVMLQVMCMLHAMFHIDHVHMVQERRETRETKADYKAFDASSHVESRQVTSRHVGHIRNVNFWVCLTSILIDADDARNKMKTCANIRHEVILL